MPKTLVLKPNSGIRRSPESRERSPGFTPSSRLKAFQPGADAFRQFLYFFGFLQAGNREDMGVVFFQFGFQALGQVDELSGIFDGF